MEDLVYLTFYGGLSISNVSDAGIRFYVAVFKAIFLNVLIFEFAV